MAAWKHRCDIRQYVSDDSLSPQRKLEKIADELSRCRAFDNTTFADELLEICGLDEAEHVPEGNCLLDKIYAYAEANLIRTSK